MAKNTGIIKSIITVGSGTMVSRVLGFVRDVLIANFLGAGMIADAFFVAFKLPNLFRSLFAEGAFNVAFVPMFSEKLAAKDDKNANETAKNFAKEAMTALFYIVLLFSALAEILMPLVIMVQAPGFLDEPEKFQTAILMSRITFPYLLLVSLNSLQSGVLNSLGFFAAASLTPVLLNITMIASLFAIAPLCGGNYGFALAYGVTIAGVLQFLFLVYHTRHAGFPIGIMGPIKLLKRKSSDLKTLLKRIIPGVFGSGIYQINMYLDTLFLSFLSTGAVSWLYYANRLYLLPVGIIGAAIGTALLPVLTRQLKSGEVELAQNSLNRALEFAMLLTMPAAAGLIALNYPIISVLFERGKFLPEATLNTSYALSAYAIGLPAYILTKALAPVFYARGDTKTPVKIALVALFGYIGLCSAFLYLLPGNISYLAIALACGIVAWINVFQYVIRIKKQKLHKTDKTLWKRLLSITISSTIMCIIVRFCYNYSLKFNWLSSDNEIIRFTGLSILCLIGGSVFGVLVLLTKGVRISDIKRIIKRK
ncbi:MAG: murein biosynthesis integral membrane protein MurJ [Alphaproteobacteria bacterium]|nr:murein biosynthesis integral membrane protein MurJ [Alphaproteobacteria bacterium]